MLRANSQAHRVYWCVVRHGPVTAWEVSELIGMDCNKASSRLHKLWKRGHLVRLPGGGPKGGHRYTSKVGIE